MKNLNLVIGHKLKDIRNKRDLTLDDVANLTGVSKAMLGQIERGKSNPTVSTLWKISCGLKVSFSAFVDESKEDLQVINQEDIYPIVRDNKMRIYPIFPFDAGKGFEVLTVELKSGCSHESEPHNDGMEEYVIVTQGEIEIEIDKEIFILKKGYSIGFKANKYHRYRNISNGTTIFQNIVVYKI